jgi:flagellar protein FlgJ
MTTNPPIGPTAPLAPSAPLAPPPGGAAAQDFLDVQGLGGLKAAAGSSPHDPATLRAVAQQFEALMIGMVMKSMRDAKLGSGLLDSNQSDMYQEMLDQQLALTMSQGRGIGIADLLVRSLTPHTVAADAAHNAYTKSLKRTAPGPAVGAVSAGPTIGAAAPAPIAEGAAAPGALASTPTEFVSLVLPEAEAAGAALGVDPLALVAQAAVESNWGRQIPATDGGSSYNLFGIKADAAWAGRRTVKETVEYANGIAERRREPFRAYDSVAHGFQDYVAFLQGSSRYSGALQQGGDGGAFISALHRAGYATDPAYSTKINAVLRSPVLRDAVAALKNQVDEPIF